ncbi:MAG: hypothetical protein HY554_12345 [Elusimicrobia bacterium]|nr:hypothetical protein [Elusimicrobiota bacterium]
MNAAALVALLSAFFPSECRAQSMEELKDASNRPWSEAVVAGEAAAVSAGGAAAQRAGGQPALSVLQAVAGSAPSSVPAPAGVREHAAHPPQGRLEAWARRAIPGCKQESQFEDCVAPWIFAFPLSSVAMVAVALVPGGIGVVTLVAAAYLQLLPVLGASGAAAGLILTLRRLAREARRNGRARDSLGHSLSGAVGGAVAGAMSPQILAGLVLGNAVYWSFKGYLKAAALACGAAAAAWNAADGALNRLVEKASER